MFVFLVLIKVYIYMYLYIYFFSTGKSGKDIYIRNKLHQAINLDLAFA